MSVMSAQEGHRYPAARSRTAARVHHLERTLRSYGPLTHARLLQFSGAEHWERGAFGVAINEMLRSGRARDLGGVIYAIAESPSRAEDGVSARGAASR